MCGWTPNFQSLYRDYLNHYTCLPVLEFTYSNTDQPQTLITILVSKYEI